MVVGQRFRRLALAAGLAAMVNVSFGQALSGTNSQRPAYFRILQQHRVFVAGHSVTYNFVAPPALLSTPPPSAAPVTPVSSLPDPGTDYRYVIFSATVYDGKNTILQCLDDNGGFTAVSNVDFDYFGGIGQFQIGNTVYFYFMALDDESSPSSDPLMAQALAQGDATLPANPPAYAIVTGSASPDALSAFDDFHSYFGANETQMVQAYWQRSALAARQQLQLRLHPPVKPDPVINFWPIKSSVYLSGSSQ